MGEFFLINSQYSNYPTLPPWFLNDRFPQGVTSIVSVK